MLYRFLLDSTVSFSLIVSLSMIAFCHHRTKQCYLISFWHSKCLYWLCGALWALKPLNPFRREAEEGRVFMWKLFFLCAGCLSTGYVPQERELSLIYVLAKNVKGVIALLRSSPKARNSLA